MDNYIYRSQNNTGKTINAMYVKIILGASLIIFSLIYLIPSILIDDIEGFLIGFIFIVMVLILWKYSTEDDVYIYSNGISKTITTWDIILKNKPQIILFENIDTFYIVKYQTVPSAECVVKLTNGTKIKYDFSNINKECFVALVKALHNNVKTGAPSGWVPIVGTFKDTKDTISLEDIDKW